MTTAQSSAPDVQKASDPKSGDAAVTSKAKEAPNVHLRKCLVTGEELQKSAMIRFVIGPDQAVVPDLAQNLPGRGLWVSASHDAISAAAKKNLFAKAAHEPAKPGPDLADQTAALMRARLLSLLGLAKGAGIATLGQTQVETELRAKRISVVFIADDAGRDIEKLGPLLDDVTVTRLFNRGDLGAALGYAQIVYAGLARHSLTTKIRDTLKMYVALLPNSDIPNATPIMMETDA